MSQVEQLRKGMVLRHEGHLFTVVEFHTAQSGKQKPTVHVKLRALQDGHPVERTLAQLGMIDEVASEVREMQYLYVAGNDRVFMDSQTFEQYPLSHAQLAGAEDYLVEEQTYRMLCVEGQPVAPQLPPAVVMEIVDTAPPAHAGSASSVLKEARVGSGRTIMVPMFVKKGDKVRVSTDSGEYQGKEH